MLGLTRIKCMVFEQNYLNEDALRLIANPEYFKDLEYLSVRVFPNELTFTDEALIEICNGFMKKIKLYYCGLRFYKFNPSSPAVTKQITTRARKKQYFDLSYLK